MVQADGGRTLPRKENDLFKSIVKYYELKQYKKGLKAADAVLRKFPNHGETLAMRGLVLNCLDRKTEAYEHVKRGLKADMRSHVCWHVYGLLHRSDRQYNDAIKSYKQALRIDSENIQILRDLSLLQVQMRDCPGFLATRKELLRLKPNNKMHWIAYALANHLCGANETAIQVIDAYNNTMEQTSQKANYEDSELALYRNVILEEEGRYAEALAHLYACEKTVVDVRSWRERRAHMLLYTRADGAAPAAPASSVEELRSRETSGEVVAAWTELLTSNMPSADNYAYHRGLQLALLVELSAERCRELMTTQRACELPTDATPLSPEQVARLDAAYAALAAAYPRAEAYRWMPLVYAPEGPDFDARLDAAIRRLTKRGAPALGSSLERLWEPKPGDVVSGRSRGRGACERTLALVDAHLAALRETGRYADASLEAGVAALKLDTAPNGASGGGDEVEPPTSLLWVLYLRAHCLEWLGDLEAALATIDECISHTPSGVDFYEKRARLLKRSGLTAAAADTMDAARQLDLADRYINNKATKYLLRAGRIEEARVTAALFTRPEAGDAELHLKEMQAHWYELEVGAALARDGQVGPALKKFVAVLKHFTDFIDDQFDFHTYCVRKMTLRAYVSVLRFEDRIRGHVAFRRAAVAAARVYLGLHDAKVAADEARRQASLELARATPEEAAKSAEDAAAAKAKAKREKMKQRKQRAKEAARAARDDEAEDAAAKAPNDKKQQPEDDDPLGAKLLAESRDPLVEAADLVAQLEKYAPSQPETHVLAYDVAERRGKLLLATRALCRLESRCVAPAQLAAGLDFYSPRAALVDRLSSLVVACAEPLGRDGVVAAVARRHVARLCRSSADDDDLLALARLAASEARRFATEATVLPERVAAARALVRLDASTAPEATALVLGADLDLQPSRKPLAIKHFEDALRALQHDLRASQTDLDAFRSLARARFPRATAFANPP